MSGVPVRLVERGEGRVISLDCVEHHITVRRNVFTKSVPITGQRIGADANLVAASIKMVCFSLVSEMTGPLRPSTAVTENLVTKRLALPVLCSRAPFKRLAISDPFGPAPASASALQPTMRFKGSLEL